MYIAYNYNSYTHDYVCMFYKCFEFMNRPKTPIRRERNSKEATRK